MAPSLSPTNHVRDDAGMPEQQLTVCKTNAVKGPFNNVRVSPLVGAVGTASLPGFDAGDAINGILFGRDGSRLLIMIPKLNRQVIRDGFGVGLHL